MGRGPVGDGGLAVRRPGLGGGAWPGRGAAGGGPPGGMSQRPYRCRPKTEVGEDQGRRHAGGNARVAGRGAAAGVGRGDRGGPRPGEGVVPEPADGPRVGGPWARVLGDHGGGAREGPRHSGRAPRRFVRATDSNHRLPVADDLLGRAFDPPGPNESWSAGITSVPTGGCTWPWSRTRSAGWPWGGPWPRRWRADWSWMPWRWRSPAAGRARGRWRTRAGGSGC
jgi:hypothetical protein